jgi:hypothetical protein
MIVKTERSVQHQVETMPGAVAVHSTADNDGWPGYICFSGQWRDRSRSGEGGRFIVIDLRNKSGWTFTDDRESWCWGWFSATGSGGSGLHKSGFAM